MRKGSHHKESSKLKLSNNKDRAKKISDKLKGKPGHPSWCKGLTKDTDERVAKGTLAMTLTKQRKFKNGEYTYITDDYRKKLSIANTGKRHTKETIQKIKLNTKGKNKGHPAWNKGERKETNLSVAKYANKLLGKKRTYVISPRKDNKPEKKLQLLLSYTEYCFIPHFYIHIKTTLPYIVSYKDESGYEFVKKNQTDFGYHCDVYVPNLDLILECDGMYWHGYDYWIHDERIVKQSLVIENDCIVFYPKMLIRDKEIFIKLDNNLKNIYIQQKFLDIVRTLELSKQKFIVVRMWDSTINKMCLTDFEAFLSKF